MTTDDMTEAEWTTAREMDALYVRIRNQRETINRQAARLNAVWSLTTTWRATYAGNRNHDRVANAVMWCVEELEARSNPV